MNEEILQGKRRELKGLVMERWFGSGGGLAMGQPGPGGDR